MTLVAPSWGLEGRIARSIDRGRTWTLHDLPHDLDRAGAICVVSTSAGFVAVGEEGTFEASAQTSPRDGLSVIGTNRLIAWTSEDGTAWKRVPMIGEPTGSYEYSASGVAWGAAGLTGLGKVLGEGKTRLVDTSSADGSSWTVTDVGDSWNPIAVVAVENGFVAIGSLGFASLDESRNVGVWFRRDH